MQKFEPCFKRARPTWWRRRLFHSNRPAPGFSNGGVRSVVERASHRYRTIRREHPLTTRSQPSATPPPDPTRISGRRHTKVAHTLRRNVNRFAFQLGTRRAFDRRETLINISITLTLTLPHPRTDERDSFSASWRARTIAERLPVIFPFTPRTRARIAIRLDRAHQAS